MNSLERNKGGANRNKGSANFYLINLVLIRLNRQHTIFKPNRHLTSPVTLCCNALYQPASSISKSTVCMTSPVTLCCSVLYQQDSSSSSSRNSSSSSSRNSSSSTVCMTSPVTLFGSAQYQPASQQQQEHCVHDIASYLVWQCAVSASQ
jgi:hypothetical protein